MNRTHAIQNHLSYSSLRVRNAPFFWQRPSSISSANCSIAYYHRHWRVVLKRPSKCAHLTCLNHASFPLSSDQKESLQLGQVVNFKRDENSHGSCMSCTMTTSLEPSFRAPWGAGRQPCGRQRECRVDIPANATIAHNGLLQRMSSWWIILHGPPPQNTPQLVFSYSGLDIHWLDGLVLQPLPGHAGSG